jgi:hypothetical protein
MSWRQWVFKATTEGLKGRETGSARLHDTPWTLLKLAHTARKLNLEPVALETLSKL